MDKTKGDCVGANTESAPFLGDSFRKANDCSLRGSVVGLTDVSVKTRNRRNVDD